MNNRSLRSRLGFGTLVNRAAYDSGVRNDDLMLIYLDAPNDTPRAIYCDSDGHTIRYKVTVHAPNRITFESDGTQPRDTISLVLLDE